LENIPSNTNSLTISFHQLKKYYQQIQPLTLSQPSNHESEKTETQIVQINGREIPTSISGEEQLLFTRSTPLYYMRGFPGRMPRIKLFIYDISDRKSFDILDDWREEQ